MQTLPNRSYQLSATESIHHSAVLQNELESVHLLDGLRKSWLRKILLLKHANADFPQL